jgi:hypothetical protein
MGALQPEQRIAVALGLGVASGVDAAALDLGELEGRRLERALRVADAVALPSMSLLLGAPVEPHPETRSGRTLVVASLSRKAVLS